MKIQVKKVTTQAELHDCLSIRAKVFIEGQKVSVEEEVDGKDKDSDHYLLLVEEFPAGVARVRFLEHYAKI